jgi:hypothetical protein
MCPRWAWSSFPHRRPRCDSARRNRVAYPHRHPRCDAARRNRVAYPHRHPRCDAVGAKQARTKIPVMIRSRFALASPLPRCHSTASHRPRTTSPTSACVAMPPRSIARTPHRPRRRALPCHRVPSPAHHIARHRRALPCRRVPSPAHHIAHVGVRCHVAAFHRPAVCAGGPKMVSWDNAVPRGDGFHDAMVSWDNAVPRGDGFHDAMP